MSSEKEKIQEAKKIFDLIDGYKTNEALEFIASGKCIPEVKNRLGETALICACKDFLPEVALALIRTGRSIPGHIAGTYTALMWCCEMDHNYDTGSDNLSVGSDESSEYYNESDDDNVDGGYRGNSFHGGYNMPVDMSEVALALIETGESRPEVSNYLGMTALMYACANDDEYYTNTIDVRVPLALIATGKSRPEKIGEEFDGTALWYALENRRKEWRKVVKALIETGKSRPGYLLNDETPLMWACKNKKSDIAIALLETGKSNYEFENEDGRTAYDIALEKGLDIVAKKILYEKEKKENTLNLGLLFRSKNPTHKRLPETVFDTVKSYFGGKKSGKKKRKIQ